MNEFIPPILWRIYRKARILTIYPSYRQYIKGIGPGHLLRGIPKRVTGDAAADPTEYVDHYDAFSFWAAQKIFARREKLRLLDIGSPKMMNCMLSAVHDVTSLVLADCGDRISKVQYIEHDVSEKLPFANHTFDVCTSTVSLQLVGLARYGDQLNPNCLIDLVTELARVMKPGSDLIVSMMLGKNALHFNNSWFFFDMPMIGHIFHDWFMVDHLVDQAIEEPVFSGPTPEPTDRFTKDTAVGRMGLSDSRVIFLHFRRSVV